MYIFRYVDGKRLRFELSDRERYDAYREQLEINDREDILSAIDFMEDSEIQETYGVSKKRFEELSDKMARCMRKTIDRDDCSWQFARDWAISCVIELEDGE